MICLYYNSYTKSYICTFWYNFYTVLDQFLETGTSDGTLIGLNLLRFSSFSLYPRSFFLYSPCEEYLKGTEFLESREVTEIVLLVVLKYLKILRGNVLKFHGQPIFYTSMCCSHLQSSRTQFSNIKIKISSSSLCSERVPL